MKTPHTCPYCGHNHRNQEFSPYCDIDCVMADRREYDRECDLMEEEWREKQMFNLKRG